jgi:hypothetical protein
MANINQTLALAVLLMLPIFGYAVSIEKAEPVKLSAWLDKSTYQLDERITVYAKVVDPDGTPATPDEGTVVTATQLRECPPGMYCTLEYYPTPIKLNYDEQSGTYKTDGLSAKPLGTKIIVSAAKGGAEVSQTLVYAISATSPVTLSAWLDKSAYQPNEKIAVYAKVVDSDGTLATPEEGTVVTAEQPYACRSDPCPEFYPAPVKLAYSAESGIYKTDNFIAQETGKSIIVRATKGSAEISQTLAYSISSGMHDAGVTSLEMPRQIALSEPLTVAGTVKNFGSTYEKVTLTLSISPAAVALQQTAVKQIAPISGTATAATASVVVSSSASTITEGGALAQIQTLELQPSEERQFRFKAGPLAAGEYEVSVYASAEGDANSANNRASGIVSVVTAQQPLLISDAKLDRVTYAAGDEMRVKARVLFADGTPATPQAGTVVWANIIGYMATTSTAQTQQAVAAVQTQTVVSQQEKTEYIPPELRGVALQYNQDTQAYEGTLKAPSSAGSYAIVISATAKEYQKATAYLPFIVSGSALHDVGISIEPIRGVQAGSAFEVRGTLTNYGASKESVTVMLRITGSPLCRSEVCPAVAIPVVYETKTTVEMGPNEKRSIAFPVGPLGAGAYFAQLDSKSEVDQNKNNDFADAKFEVTGAVPSRKIALQKGWNMFSKIGRAHV